jgi:hypothetical protein
MNEASKANMKRCICELAKATTADAPPSVAETILYHVNNLALSALLNPNKTIEIPLASRSTYTPDYSSLYVSCVWDEKRQERTYDMRIKLPRKSKRLCHFAETLAAVAWQVIDQYERQPPTLMLFLTKQGDANDTSQPQQQRQPVAPSAAAIAADAGVQLEATPIPLESTTKRRR